MGKVARERQSPRRLLGRVRGVTDGILVVNVAQEPLLVSDVDGFGLG